MKRNMFLVMLCFLSAPSVGFAQQREVDMRRDEPLRATTATEGLRSSLMTTPEMWLYEQERSRQDDPKMAVRRRAEQRASDRQARIASSEWYGVSNSRPTVSPIPWFTSYGPHWGSNTFDPFRWRAVAAPLVVTRPTGPAY